MLLTWGQGGGLNVGLSFWLPLDDLGAGAVSTTPNSAAGSATATFTRATTATTTLSTGLIAGVASGTARSLYSQAAVNLGYLAEPAATNLVLQSAFAASWVLFGATYTGNQTASPDGTVTAGKLAEDNANNFHGIDQSIAKAASAITYTSTVYAKQVERTWLQLTLDDASTNGIRAWFNLATGVVGSTLGVGTPFTSVSTSITAAANGFYRCTLTATSNTALAIRHVPCIANADLAGTYVGTAGSGIFIWGAQLEQAAVATSYIPTTTGSVTRNIDRLTYPVSGNLATNNATIYLEWTPSVASQGTVFLWGSYVDANNSTGILHNGTNLIFRKRIAGVNTDATIALTYVGGTTYKIAARASGAAGQDVFLNGVKGTNNATVTAMQLGTNFELGNDGNGASAQIGALRNDRSWSVALTDGQLVSLTS